MSAAPDRYILTLNAGSSSLKFALYRMGSREELLLSGNLQRIGFPEGTVGIHDGCGTVVMQRTQPLPDHAQALAVVLPALREPLQGQALHAVGHRIVHGGPRLTRSQPITPAVVETLRELIPLAPNHLPGEIVVIEAMLRERPELPQVACFDTAFHQTMPAVACTFALPREYTDSGVRRYGFHGLSYEYIVEELQREAGADVAAGRLVIAHLGNGASLAAVRAGKGVDTTMGLTPLAGLVMGTRCGDLDPGVVLYLQREKGLSEAQVEELLSKRSGLLGVSGFSSDMADLLRQEASNSQAAEAVALFCYQAAKHIAAMTVAAGGLDTLIFTAGIGEHAAPVRARICEHLAYLGVQLDAQQNQRHAPIISTAASAVTVRVMHTKEELMIARQTLLVANGGI
jgi:acetate kinase